MTSDGQREKTAKTSVLCEQQLHPLPVSQQHEAITFPDLAAVGHHARLIEGSNKTVKDGFPFRNEVDVHVLCVNGVFFEFLVELNDGLLVGQNHVDSRRSGPQ
ncbi:hypothetical protein OUZ56_033450 [Daphnia magna]|uniref:Uncharacterized protein n=1 Tax=Daphnia magna TaxID=35525 RepID=A0ABR0BAQ9_9CRUS|nr:hypothetical protein OUZ56_033450 [Daphnia magna]